LLLNSGLLDWLGGSEGLLLGESLGNWLPDRLCRGRLCWLTYGLSGSGLNRLANSLGLCNWLSDRLLRLDDWFRLNLGLSQRLVGG